MLHNYRYQYQPSHCSHRAQGDLAKIGNMQEKWRVVASEQEKRQQLERVGQRSVDPESYRQGIEKLDAWVNFHIRVVL